MNKVASCLEDLKDPPPPSMSPRSRSANYKKRSSFVTETPGASFIEGENGLRTLNQYSIKHTIGRGAFGVVSLAVDGEGTEWAIKEFSKSRLRKKSHSNVFRGPAGRGRGRGRGSASVSGRSDDPEADSPWYLIRGEIAIMKKLSHENVVELHEVLDDPKQDSLWMVFEMCHRGVTMDIDLDSNAKPYTEDEARVYFRQLTLGMEYLHENDICHRDIKPDNLLLTKDNTLKIVDFGVSMMFSNGSDKMKRSAGSPAFMAPELCTAQGQGEISGRAADLWSMGVTLFCYCFGNLPFPGDNLPEIFETICNKTLQVPSTASKELSDLLSRLLEKDPDQRLTMLQLRDHPWLTQKGEDPLPSTDDNCERVVEQVTEEDIKQAVRNINSIFMVLKAVSKLKKGGSLHSLKNASTSTSESETTSVTASLTSLDNIVVEEKLTMEPSSWLPIRVLFFAGAKDAVDGLESYEISLKNKESVTPREVIAILSEKFPALVPILPSIMLAVNLEYVDKTSEKALIKQGDEVALIPPVSGG